MTRAGWDAAWIEVVRDGIFKNKKIPTQAGKCVDSIDIHRAAAADTLSATPPKGEGGVYLVLDSNQSV